ncbi:MAG: hypothetical protein ACAH24_00515, partial [Hyphomicrobiaceae bacterium]
MKLCKTLAFVAAVALASATAHAQAPERKDVKLGVGGGAALYYLPLALTEKLGHLGSRASTSRSATSR